MASVLLSSSSSVDDLMFVLIVVVRVLVYLSMVTSELLQNAQCLLCQKLQ